MPDSYWVEGKITTDLAELWPISKKVLPQLESQLDKVEGSLRSSFNMTENELSFAHQFDLQTSVKVLPCGKDISLSGRVNSSHNLATLQSLIALSNVAIHHQLDNCAELTSLKEHLEIDSSFLLNGELI